LSRKSAVIVARSSRLHEICGLGDTWKSVKLCISK
jgi:hypothetical protein